MPITKEKETKTKDYVFVKCVRIIEVLFIFATSFLKEKCQKREAVVNVLIVLCRLQKSHDFRRKKNSSTIKFKCEKTTQIIVWRSSFFVSLLIECLSTQCIFCLDNKALSTLKRLWSFSRHDDLKQHFHRKHLRHHSNGQFIACSHSKCNINLNDKMHLQNYAQVMHKTST